MSKITYSNIDRLALTGRWRSRNMEFNPGRPSCDRSLVGGRLICGFERSTFSQRKIYHDRPYPNGQTVGQGSVYRYVDSSRFPIKETDDDHLAEDVTKEPSTKLIQYQDYPYGNVKTYIFLLSTRI